MSRPSKFPRWADVGGILVEPTEAKKDIGWITAEHPPAQFLNWWENLVNQWLQYYDGPLIGLGDGSDGDVVLDGTVAAPSGMTKVGSTYGMNRDFFFKSLLVTGASVQLNPNSHRCYCQGTAQFTAGAKLFDYGNDAIDALGGAARATNTLLSGADGADGPAAGGVTPGNPGHDVTNGYGGAGGNGPGGGGATGGTVTAPTGDRGSIHASVPGPMFGYVIGASGGTPTVTGFRGGAGGASGFSSVAKPGGGGGGGGGLLSLACRELVLDAAGDIEVKGGAGTTTTGGGATCASPGGGGGGGVVMLAYLLKRLAGGGVPTFSGATNCPGGAAGAGGVAVAGAHGNIFEFPLYSL